MPLAFRVVWPLEAMSELLEEPRVKAAAVVCVEHSADMEQRLIASGLAARLVAWGVEAWSFAGQEAEQVHDALDWVIVDLGAFEVLTTWHPADDPEDVAYAVVPIARAREMDCIVLVTDTNLTAAARLRDVIAELLRSDSLG